MGQLLLRCALQPPQSLLIGGIITTSTANLQPEPSPPLLLLPTYNSEQAVGSSASFYLRGEHKWNESEQRQRDLGLLLPVSQGIIFPSLKIMVS